MKRLIPILLAVLLSGCGTVLWSDIQNFFGGGGGPANTPPSNSTNGWAAYYSYGVSLTGVPGALFAVTIPATTSACPYDSTSGAIDLCPALHYLETSASGLAYGKTITVTGQVAASAGAVFNGYTATDNVPNGQGHAPACRIWFQEKGDDLSGSGQYAYYRWWANDPGSVTLANGTFYMSALLTPTWSMTHSDGSVTITSGWTSVEGEQANNSAAATAGFQQALANASMMGITCGGGSFYGHGVNMLSGTGVLMINSFVVQ